MSDIQKVLTRAKVALECVVEGKDLDGDYVESHPVLVDICESALVEVRRFLKPKQRRKQLSACAEREIERAHKALRGGGW